MHHLNGKTTCKIIKANATKTYENKNNHRVKTLAKQHINKTIRRELLIQYPNLPKFTD